MIQLVLGALALVAAAAFAAFMVHNVRRRRAHLRTLRQAYGVNFVYRAHRNELVADLAAALVAGLALLAFGVISIVRGLA